MYCSTVSVPMTGDSWWSSSWPAADTRWSAATSAGCSPLRRVILHPVSTWRYFYVCRYFSVCWVTMMWWPVWRTADTDISTNFTANYLSLIRRQPVISGQDSAQWAVGCSGLAMWQSWHLNCPHISRYLLMATPATARGHGGSWSQWGLLWDAHFICLDSQLMTVTV